MTNNGWAVLTTGDGAVLTIGDGAVLTWGRFDRTPRIQYFYVACGQGERVLSKFSFIHIRESEQNMGILFQRYVYSIFAIFYTISYAIGDYILC